MLRSAVLLLLVLPLTARGDDRPDARVGEYAELLSHKDAPLRRQAAVALGEFGAKAKAAVPALRKALLDRDESVQLAAARALEKIDATTATPTELVRELQAARAEAAALRDRLKVREQEAAATAVKAGAALREAAEARKAAEAALRDAAEARRKAEQEARRAQDQLAEANRAQAELRAAKAEAEAVRASLKARTEQLERELERATRLLDQIKSSPRDKAPPAPDVTGEIKAIDAGSKLVTISIGSDAGLVKGQVLEVYRLGKEPRYVGSLRIVQTNATSAVGTLTGKLAAEVGDRVSSKLPKTGDRP